MMDFREDQLLRYSRHIILENIGVEGQEKIADAKVIIIGAGGLGSPVALYLAAAGVGTIGVADADRVELSNLQRQVIHFTRDVDVPKVISAREKIKALNPDVTVKIYQKHLTSKNIRQIICDFDFVIDGTDNFPAKFLINDACIMENIPFSHGGVLRFNGQTMTVIPGETACVRCLFGAPPPAGMVPSCAEAGILGAIPGILGTIQATEALKYITSTGELLTNAMLIFDAETMDFRKMKLKKNNECSICGLNPTIRDLFDEEQVACDTPY